MSDSILAQTINTQKAKRILTGIKPTGRLHFGNYVGAIKQIEALMQESSNNIHSTSEVFLMIPDAHSLTFPRNAKAQHDDIKELIASILSFDLDITKICIYRQTEVPAIFHLYWILNCFCNKGLLNRGHAFKTQLNTHTVDQAADADGEIGVGLYTYAVLMAADILAMDTNIVPVGQDQKQHIEICRDLAIKINSFISAEGMNTNDSKSSDTSTNISTNIATNVSTNIPNNAFIIPDAMISEIPVLPGTDGRKMSKSYNNYIPIFSSSEELRKAVFSVKTNSQGITEPKDPEILFQLFSGVSSQSEIQTLHNLYQTGIGWKEVKDRTYEALERFVKDKRERFDYWMNNPAAMNEVLKTHTQKANQIANATLDRVLQALGFML